MTEQQAASGFPEIKVPAALTFAALALGFAVGIVLKGSPTLDPVLAVAEPMGSLWLRVRRLRQGKLRRWLMLRRRVRLQCR